MSRLFRGKAQLRSALAKAFEGEPQKDHLPSTKSGIRKLVMTREEAKEYLSAVRPNGADAADPDIREALELAKKDSELGSSLAQQLEFDEILIETFSSIHPPEGLRESILESIEKTVRPVQF